MASAVTEPQPQPHIPWGAIRPGVKRCEYILNQLRTFQDLIRHRERMAIDIDKARPLQELLPHLHKGSNSMDAHMQLDAEIQRRILPVHQYLTLSGIPTLWNFGRPMREPMKKDIIVQWGHLPEEIRHQAYRAMMETLEMGIGAYQTRLEVARLDRRSPVYWLSYILHLPVMAAEGAGWIRTAEQHSKFTEKCMRAAWILLLIILALFAGKLGLTIPWGEIGKFIK